MKAVQNGGVKVYDLNVGKTLPQWLSSKERKSLAKDDEYRRRIELVQDFYFPSSSSRVKVSDDGEYIVATGTYPPQVKVFETRELSMKFERHLDAEVVQVQVLSPDYTKLVFLGADRTVTFHAAFGRHHMLRIPKFGRDMAYDPSGCELFLAGTGDQIYRIDLEQGHFLTPYESTHGGINSMAFCDSLQLLACAGEDGVVSCWDARDRKQVGELNVAGASAVGGAAEKQDAQATVVRFDRTGLNMAVGTSLGRVSVYDVRSSRPLMTKEHRNDLPIVGLQFTSPGRIVVSADAQSIKLWNRDTGASFANIEPQANVNDIAVVPQGDSSRPSSGLIIAPGETDRIMSYYVPRLGSAPKWASFLDNLTEELEEKSRSTEEIYENYKFVTNNDLERLGITNLIGSDLLRPYMHGYFMDIRLYNKVSSMAEPLGFEAWRKERLRTKMEERLGQRITRKMPTNLPKVNRTLAARLASGEGDDDIHQRTLKDEEEWSSDDEEQEAPAAQASKKPKRKSPAITQDDRFKALFEDPDFEMDQNSEAFKQMYPSGMRQRKQAYEDDDDDDDEDIGSDDNDMDVEVSKPSKKTKQSKPAKKAAEKPQRKRKVVMQAVQDDDDEGLLESRVSSEKSSKKKSSSGDKPRTVKTLGDKLREETSNNGMRQLQGGNMEVSFVPSQSGEGESGGRRFSNKKKGKGKFRR